MPKEEMLMPDGLTAEEKDRVPMRCNSREKRTSTAYICRFLFGAHYFYPGKPLVNILYRVTGG